MANLTRAYQQLYTRKEDERFESLLELREYCRDKCERTDAKWVLPQNVFPAEHSGEIKLKVFGDSAYGLNDWSFSQLSSIANVRKETLNRLSIGTAIKVLSETLPGSGQKPYQMLIRDDRLRAIHGVSYTRLFDWEVLDSVMKEASDFAPPPKGFNGASGLYAGEQDMFAFLIDDKSWVDIEGQQFAPGFFVWNSEVGRRTVGLETFWFQRVCSNHIVWDAREVVTYTRKHTSNVFQALDDMRLMIRQLVQIRDARKDAFVKSVRTAMTTRIGTDAEEASKALAGTGIRMGFVKQAIESIVAEGSSFTVFSAVDALTRITGNMAYAGDRVEQDQKIGKLLSMAL